MRAKPGIPGFPQFQSWFENRRVGLANKTVDAVGPDQQVILTKLRKIVYLATESQGDAQLVAAPLQDIQQALARDAGNHMASAADRPPTITYIDGIPDHEMIGDLLVGLIIRPLE